MTKLTANKSPTSSLPPAVPLAITPTISPWTHTSDDIYIYELSLVVAAATLSSHFIVYITRKAQTAQTAHKQHRVRATTSWLQRYTRLSPASRAGTNTTRVR